MKTLYLECNSGISGDMTVAALLDLGADEEVLRKGLDSLGVSGYEIRVSRVEKASIRACDFDVVLHGEDHEHPHPHEHRHEHTHEHTREHEHEHEHGRHHHQEQQSPGCEHTHHLHRNLQDIVGIIEGSGISRRAKDLAVKIFGVVARAEANVHGLPVERVHFHEVGAVDSIVDIVGAAICLDDLDVDRVICTPLREGTGTVKCQHGIMPVPAPATMEILRSHDIPVVITGVEGELVTPTGAAIVAVVADSFTPPRGMTVRRVGYGAGKRNYAHTANLLRASLLEFVGNPLVDRVVKLECNLDDMTGETLAFACEKLREAGALDVWCTPILMKKGRPAQLLSVLSTLEREAEMTALLLLHTSTLGVRTSIHDRHVMERRASVVDTPYGPVAIKESVYGKICKTQVEYESAKELANAKGIPVNQILRSAYSKLDS